VIISPASNAEFLFINSVGESFHNKYILEISGFTAFSINITPSTISSILPKFVTSHILR
jgi:hypothetical protein